MTAESEIIGSMRENIGAMKSTIEHLNETVKNMVTMWGNQERDAAVGRRTLHEKVEALKDSVVALSSRMTTLETTLAAIRPAVKEFENQREQQKGAMKLGKLIWGSLLAACGSTGIAIGWGIKTLAGLPTPPHP